MRALPIILLIACSSNPNDLVADPNDSGASNNDTGPTTTTTAATNGADVTGEVGQLTYWNQGSQHRIQLFASSHFDGLPAPAVCAMSGELCVDSLPTTPDVASDWVERSYLPSEAGVSWLGNAIDLETKAIPFTVDAETEFGGYTVQVPQFPTEPMGLITGGEWGDFTSEALLTAPAPMDDTQPGHGGYVDLGDALEISWTPGDGKLYLELTLGSANLHELWLLTDDGTHTVPATHFGALGEGDVVQATLHRMVDQPDVDINGNSLRVNTHTQVQFSTGYAQPPSCRSFLDADPTAQSGVYFIAPDPTLPPVQVYCDMDTDSGGWTLVASTNATMNDEAMSWHSELTTLNPSSAQQGVWSGMRAATPQNSDIRFACKVNGANTAMTVDLSFYNNNWYREITSGSDSDSCFNENNGVGATTPPQRRNNLTGDTLPSGNQWAAGYLEGEDSCSDTSDFTVDFDDRGMDSDQSDGTDWGEDDGSAKCGVSGTTGVWFIFVR